MGKRRHGIQLAAALLQNANFKGFFTGRIYQGNVKNVCVPGLNCYSCPGAVGACPLGSLQVSLGNKPFRFPYYVVGLLVFFGALLGRSICGFLCPVGFLQELLHKIPFFRKIRTWKGDRALRYLKYGVLAVFVLALPLALAQMPGFCKYICPGGTIAGIFLAAAEESIPPLLGGLFTWKAVVLAAVVIVSLVIWRPFCKYLCPLGALYGFFNRISLHRLRLRPELCVGCARCARACRMCVDPVKNLNAAECIRCGDCAVACPTGALDLGWGEAKGRGRTQAPDAGEGANV